MNIRKQMDIFQAIADKDIHLIQALVNSGTDLSVTNAEGLKPIQGAKKIGFWEAVKVIAVSTQDKEDRFHFGAALLTAIEEDQPDDIVKVLIKAKAHTNWYLPPENNYPLHFAVINNNLTNINRLLRSHADITKKNNQNQTPVQLACYLGYFSIVELFLKYIQRYKGAADGIHTQAELVDMNARFNGDKSTNRTLAWELAAERRWDILWEFAKIYPIDLSVRPQPKNKKDKPFRSLAELLADDDKWELFYQIIANDTFSDADHFECMLLKPYGNSTLVEYWIKSDNLTCERFFNRCKEDFLLNLRISTSSTSLLFAKTTFVYAKRLQEQCNTSLVENDLLEAKSNLKELFTVLLTITEKSADYAKSQIEIANIIHNRILPCEKLHNWAVDYLKPRLNLITTFYDVSSSDELKLRMIMMQCAAKGGDGWLATNLYAETLKHNIALRNENDKLKQKIHKANHSSRLFDRRLADKKIKIDHLNNNDDNSLKKWAF
jgi:hypothetical protein